MLELTRQSTELSVLFYLPHFADYACYKFKVSLNYLAPTAEKKSYEKTNVLVTQ